MSQSRVGAQVMACHIDALTWDQSLSAISRWAGKRASRYVCLCNVHSVVTASKNNALRLAIEGADMATPDGMPLALLLRQAGFRGQPRVNGPDLMWKYCELAALTRDPIFLYGSSEQTLNRLSDNLRSTFPRLRIAGVHAPPFGALSDQEITASAAMINGSGAGAVFVGMGCPKQELWMAAQRGSINAVMIGVGAAFDYHAGTVARAPNWMQSAGLEWLYRLCSEPRRLWRRYFVTNSIFLLHLAGQRLAHNPRNVRDKKGCP